MTADRAVISWRHELVEPEGRSGADGLGAPAWTLSIPAGALRLPPAGQHPGDAGPRGQDDALVGAARAPALGAGHIGRVPRAAGPAGGARGLGSEADGRGTRARAALRVVRRDRVRSA